MKGELVKFSQEQVARFRDALSGSAGHSPEESKLWSCECVRLHVCVCLRICAGIGRVAAGSHLHACTREGDAQSKAETRGRPPNPGQGWRCYQGPAALFLQAKAF